jgi:ribosomal protein L22
VVDEAPPLKRSRHQSMGRVFPVRKRACHVTIDLDIPQRPASG